MKLDAFRREMDEYWSRVDRESMGKKDSHGTIMELMNLYRRFDRGEQSMANQVIIEWLRSPEPRKRFDALALVDELIIIDALPSLRELQDEIENRTDHEVPYDWTLVNRIIARLRTPTEDHDPTFP